MDKCSGFWQVELARAAQELLAFVTPKGRVFRWKVVPFGVANAPALFQELMNKILYTLRSRPLVQELVSREAEMDVSLGTNTQEDHILLLQEFFTVCQENHLHIELEKCKFMREEMEYLGFDVRYGWWKRAASKMRTLQDMQMRDDPKKGFTTTELYWRLQFLPAPYPQFYVYISPPDSPLKRDQPLAMDRQERGLFPGVEEENFLYQLPGGTRP